VVQSEKGADGLPLVHYSLKEKMLSDLRAERTKVRKLEAEEKDKLIKMRWTAKQNAIKVVSNSEYGASGNKQFAHYDPNVAAGVTYCSRRLINFLTTSLQTETLYVDDKFINDNSVDIKPLFDIGFFKIESNDLQKFTKEEILVKYRHKCLRRLFDDDYNIIDHKEIRKLRLYPSTVIYQDTDSNYYTNEYIVNYFTHFQGLKSNSKDLNSSLKRRNSISNFNTEANEQIISPEIIHNCMVALVHHNNFYAKFTECAIQRRPISLSFEGAFIVCRYLNRKKKYYGIKWNHGMKYKLNDQAYIINPNCLTSDPNTCKMLKDDYSEFWEAKNIVPQPNGSYISLNTEELLGKSNTNYLDYVQSYGVKCTGVDLARRDQFRFVNFSHLYTLQRDLRIMKYNGNDSWSIISKSESMIEVIENILREFLDTMSFYGIVSGAIEKHYKNKQTKKQLTKTDVSSDSNDSIEINSNEKIESSESVENEKLDIFGSIPEIIYNVLDFCRTKTYKADKRGPYIEIIDRLKLEHKEKYIPQNNERACFLIVETEEVQRKRQMGIANAGTMASRSYMLQELMDDVETKYPKDQYPEVTIISTPNNNQSFEENEKRLTEASLPQSVRRKNISYKEFINYKIISMLDTKHYFTALIQALSLYIIGDKFPQDIERIDNGEYTAKEIGEKIDKLKNLIVKEYVDINYPCGRARAKEAKAFNKNHSISYMPQAKKKRPLISEDKKKAIGNFLNVQVTDKNYDICFKELNTRYEQFEKKRNNYLRLHNVLKSKISINTAKTERDKLKYHCTTNKELVGAYVKQIEKYETLMQRIGDLF
jgi:hypothetical protein